MRPPSQTARSGELTSADAFAPAAAAYAAGRFSDAERICLAVLERDRERFDAIRLLAILQHRRGLCIEALAAFERALAIAPDHAETLSNRGNALSDLKRFAEALSSYDRALAIEPDFADAHYNRGLLLNEIGRFADALASFDKALACCPGNAEALNNRGNVLRALDRHEEALASYEAALAVRQDFAEAHNNRGVTLYRLGRFTEALASYDKALALSPGQAEAHNNRGVTLKELRRIPEALASYRRAQQLAPGYADAHWNEALLRLLIGDFPIGLPQYEWRWKRRSFTSPRRGFAEPQWDGSDCRGRTILLYGEQGFGDVIQFCRYVPSVVARGAQVILEVEEPLCRLMGSLGAVQVLPSGARLPPFELQCPLTSLPLALRTTIETIPAAVPYLAAPPEAAAAWDATLGPRKRLRIGLAWAGNPRQENDRNRSIGLAQLLPLLELDADFVSLQKDLRPGDKELLNARRDILHLGVALNDFSDAAALIECMDVVVSVDTSTAHLAAALGKPVFIMLCFTPDWRWLLSGDLSPWYPTARLLRQARPQDWSDPVALVAGGLKTMIAGGAANAHGATASNKLIRPEK